MNMWANFERKEKFRIQRLLGLELVSYVIRKGKFR